MSIYFCPQNRKLLSKLLDYRLLPQKIENYCLNSQTPKLLNS